MNYDEAVFLLDAAFLSDVDWSDADGNGDSATEKAAAARARARMVEKTIYDRGFAAAAALHVEISFFTQNR